MNIFGAFTFGSLIKTFLPGFVWLVAIGILEADVQELRSAEPFILGYADAHEQAALILAIPASILLGLMSNIVVFMGVNDRLVRNPARRRDPGLFGLYELLSGRVRDRCWEAAGCQDRAAREDFQRHADVELIMLPSLGADKLAYVREQYWYHLEFQVNLLLSIVCTLLGLVFRAAISADSVAVFGAHLLWCLALGVPVCVLLVRAARKNYHRHIAKMASLMAAFLEPRPQGPG